jgi:hypothetical protein
MELKELKWVKCGDVEFEVLSAFKLQKKSGRYLPLCDSVCFK